ncbi:galactokinase [Sporosarcina sp. BI001-red]|uniref:galactokinase n=1 Tax=Sporosarcina sp. BI001-red TaxID=2282866 RepID=UPI000E274FC7|nr:galactokinase [Sporosarcina sp. BI001-red]REB10100.1 galactokinase [Sporosarcina sp. BI001-red]
MTVDLFKEFDNVFTAIDKLRIFFAPGRINLIGEHTDYNQGHVFPAAISFGTYAIAQKRQDKKLCFYSLNFPETGIIECDLNDLSYKQEHGWANFPKGMISYIEESTIPLPTGMDILFYGDIPNGAGLSSSASIEMVTGVLVDGLFDLHIDRHDLILLGQKVENKYIGVNSGIMDQFAIGKGKKDHGILLNCQTLDYKYAPIQLDNYSIIIINTNIQRILAASKYNERRAQCEQALSDLQIVLSLESLGNLTIGQFEQHKHVIQNKVNEKRAKHVVFENSRTLEAFKQLEKGNLNAFGLLMNESHQSLQSDYEVTGLELDTIVHTAWGHPGVLGARMTGAGFGGCAIALVEKNQVTQFKQQIREVYHKKTGNEASFYIAAIGDGAKEITEGVI